MRRILWTLAASTAITASVSSTTAQERFGPQETWGQREPATGRMNLSFPSGRTAGTVVRSETSTPGGTFPESFGSDSQQNHEARPFPPVQQTLPPAGTLSDQRASDLFRRDLSGTRSSAGQVLAREREEDGFRQVSGEATEPARRVIYAEYERAPGQVDRVQPVGGEEPAAGYPAASYPPSTGRDLPGGTTNSRLEFGRSLGTRSSPVGGSSSRLMDPIPTSPGSRTIDLGPSPSGQVQSSRGVTLQRSLPDNRGSALPVTRSPQTILPTAATTYRPSGAAKTAAAALPAAGGMDPLGALGQQVRSGPQSPTVSVEWVTRSGINVGQECDCDLVIKNTGIIPASNVELTAHFPASVRLVSVEPQPAEADSHLLWRFAELQPSQEQIIRIKLIPSERGTIQTQADIRFSGTAATSLTVAEPLLEVACEGPNRVLVGEPASQTVVIKNPGSGIATNVQIEAIIPEGLEHARGNRLVMDVGSLNPGETRNVRLALAAIKGGKQVVQIQGRADGDLVRNTQSEVFVVAPSLVAEIEGPGLRYLGRNATYVLRVRNDGEINVENVRVMHKLPEGFEVVESDRGAQFDRANRLVNWFVGRLAAGATAEIKVTVRADRIGSFTHFVRATSEHGAISDAQFTTQVEGTPALVMNIRDLDDPVEVGAETAYEIVVKNEGSAPARGVSLACEIPAGVEVLRAQGPVDSIKQRDLVTFNPVLELAPGNSITYRVHVRGSTTGHHRLRARLSSESMPEPLTVDEQTRFYGE